MKFRKLIICPFPSKNEIFLSMMETLFELQLLPIYKIKCKTQYWLKGIKIKTQVNFKSTLKRKLTIKKQRLIFEIVFVPYYCNLMFAVVVILFCF